MAAIVDYCTACNALYYVFLPVLCIQKRQGSNMFIDCLKYLHSHRLVKSILQPDLEASGNR